MKSLKFFAINLTLLFAFQASLFAQSKSVTPTKIALVSFEKFSEAPAGIKDLIVIYEKLDQEFKPQNQELTILVGDYNKLHNELSLIAKIREPRAQIESMEKKINEYESLLCKILTKQNTARSLYDERKAFLREKIDKKIAESLKEYAKEKGYTVILDGSQKNIVIEGETVDITNEFIQFYNSKTEKAVN